MASWNHDQPMSDSAYPDALPAQYRLHWYVLERVLGQGGFGITYLARDTNLDQAVAIKEYLPVDVATRRADTTVRPRSDEQAERYRWGLDRFIKEARTLARFDHPNIVRVLSVFEHNGTAYIVMRFEEGENFAALLERRRTLPENELMNVLLPVLDGLELVHGANFIHRDIKPDNIHIRDDGSPVLLDFGSARHALGQARTVTILVAPGYAPFEQYYSSGEDQGPWTDLYSLGATCYRAIAGVAPMDAIARSKGILGSTREILVPATAIGAGRYSERLLKAIDHALAFAEKERPQSIAAWRQELLPRTTAPAPRPAAPRGPAAESAGASAASSRPPLARTAWLVAAVVLIAAVGGGVGAYMAMERARSTPVAESVPAPAPAPAVTPPAPAIVAPAPAAPAPEKAATQPVADAPTSVAATQDPLKSADRQKPAAADSKPKPAQKTALPRKVTPEPSAAARPSTESEAKPATACPSGDAAAFACYRELAKRGDADAALRLGEMYESGRGVLASNNWAYMWFLIAERRGAAGAKAKRDAIAPRLQPKELEQAESQARGVAR